MLVAHVTDAPLVFVVVVPIIVAVVLAEMSAGGIDAKAVAMLGILTALGAILRPLGAGLGGHRDRVPAAHPRRAGVRARVRVRARLHHVVRLGAAHRRGGPVAAVPDARRLMGRDGAGLLPRLGGRAEVAMLAAYGGVSAFVFGVLMNLWSWPFVLGTGTELSFVPGDPLVDNLRRFVGYSLATSLGWEVGRAVTNIVLIALVGSAVLGALRRADRRFAFHPAVRFTAASLVGDGPLLGGRGGPRRGGGWGRRRRTAPRRHGAARCRRRRGDGRRSTPRPADLMR